MPEPLDHNYISFTDVCLMERSSESSNLSIKCENDNILLNLKATELRLGLPGFSNDLEKNRIKNGDVKKFVSGAKRGFSDVDANCVSKWGFNGGSESNLGICSSSSAILSPRSRGRINGGLESDQTNTEQSIVEEKMKAPVTTEIGTASHTSKAQVVGWPPIRSFRKNTMATNLSKKGDVAKGYSRSRGCVYVKVSMDGAPYLRKVDLNTCHNYGQLSKALEKMFSCFTLGECTCNGFGGEEGVSESNLKDVVNGSECVLTYEDKDGDWMLVGDVPWEMFIDSCKRLRIMKGSEATGLGKSHNWKK